MEGKEGDDEEDDPLGGDPQGGVPFEALGLPSISERHSPRVSGLPSLSKRHPSKGLGPFSK